LLAAVATRVAIPGGIVPAAGVHRSTEHVAATLRVHGHLVVFPSDRWEAIALVSGVNGREEIDDEA